MKAAKLGLFGFTPALDHIKQTTRCIAIKHKVTEWDAARITLSIDALSF